MIRRVRLRAFAKINLSLLILGKRADGYHELRTIFQTISLADVLEIEYEAAPQSSIEIRSKVDIPDNLVLHAAATVMNEMGVTGRVRFRLKKRIPMGGGLGGGSSDAAAVLLALPALAGREVPFERLLALAAELGSDVPFFLHGGTAFGLGRGEELYRLPSVLAQHAAVVVPNQAVSTAQAYADLETTPVDKLTLGDRFNRMKRFQSLTAGLVCSPGRRDWTDFCENDFEAAVFRRYPVIQSLQDQLLRLGAEPAMLSGSGSALFGIFNSRVARDQGCAAMRAADVVVEPVSFVSRERYRAAWLNSLAAFLVPSVNEKQWPPQGR